MENELVNIKEVAAQLVKQDADKIINVSTIEKVDNSFLVFIGNGVPGMPGYGAEAITFSSRFYNLIICDNEKLDTAGTITINRRHCLVENDDITQDLKEKYSSLTSEAIVELMTFPCLVANKNAHDGWADDNQVAILAKLESVAVSDENIKLQYRAMFGVSQAKLCKLIEELGISGRYGRHNEWNHCHWTVKEKDLCTVINGAGLNPTVQNRK